MKSSMFVSVVVPLYNDAGIIERVVRETTDVLKSNFENYELILIDDGSIDNTVEIARPLLREIESIRIMRLSRHFGVEIALTAGLESAIGDFVVTMLPSSDPPALIPSLVDLSLSSRGIVVGIDKEWRRRGFRRRAAGRLFHLLCERVLGIEIPEHATRYWVLPRQAVNAVIQIKDKFRHLRALAPYIGFQTTTLEYIPINRRGNRIRTPFLDDLEDAVNIIVGTTTRPLRIISLLGLVASLLNILYIGYILAIAIFKERVAEGWITLSFQNAVMFFLIFSILTVVTEYMGRILSETKERPLYYVREELNSSVGIANQDRRNVVTESE